MITWQTAAVPCGKKTKRSYTALLRSSCRCRECLSSNWATFSSTWDLFHPGLKPKPRAVPLAGAIGAASLSHHKCILHPNVINLHSHSESPAVCKLHWKSLFTVLLPSLEQWRWIWHPRLHLQHWDYHSCSGCSSCRTSQKMTSPVVFLPLENC